MTAVVFVFEVHQPWRLRRYSFFDIGAREDYFDAPTNRRILERVAERCYRPTVRLLGRLAKATDGAFRLGLSVTGTAIEQLTAWAPDVLDDLRRLAADGAVEMLAETYHHTLSSLYPSVEFEAEVEAHRKAVEQTFGQVPKTFRNTELICSNDIARRVEALGFSGILCEGADRVLGWRSPHRVYRPEGAERIKLLLRAYRLSDDVAFRFGDRGWDGWPLSAERYASWLDDVDRDGDEPVTGLFMDLETFGEHQAASTGIFRFLEDLPAAVLTGGRTEFLTPSEALARVDPIGRLDLPRPVSWADTERDLTAWTGNPMQRAARDAHNELAPRARAAAGAGRPDLLDAWRRLATSDHLYYMSLKGAADGEVHGYFSPFATPHDAFITYMNVIDDLARRLGSVPAPATSPSDSEEE